MPTDKEFAFGKRAVEEGLLEQGHLEEAVELLHSLERVGSDKRLWDVLVEHGWLRSDDADRLRGVGEAATVMNTPSLPPETLPGGYTVAHIKAQGEPQVIPLKHRPMSFGREADNDVTLSEPRVEMRHARITFGPEGPRVWDMGSASGVVVNGKRRRNQDIKPFDLIRIGDAILTICYELETAEPLPEPVTPAHAVGKPVGRFIVEQGAREGATFFLGERGVVFGRHRLAAVRLTDAKVAMLHVHVVVTDKGVEFLDLKSPFGTAHNGKHTNKGLLEHGDTLTMGEAVVRFEMLGKGEIAAPAAEPKARPAAPPKPKEPGDAGEDEPKQLESDLDAPEKEDDSSSSIFEIPANAELKVDEDADDPFGLKKGPVAPWLITPAKSEDKPAATQPTGRKIYETISDDTQSRRENERYKPGEVCLLATSGPIKGQFLPIVEREMSLGRENDVSITIPDPSVSRRHARFVLSAEGVLEVEDLGSRNGVILNGRPVSKAAIFIGDVVKLGTTILRVQRAKKQ